MEFLEVKKCEADYSEPVKYKYVYNMNDDESIRFKMFLTSLFGYPYNTVYGGKVNTFELRMGKKVSKINGIDFGLLYCNSKILDMYIKANFNAYGLNISDSFFDGKKLLVYSYTIKEDDKDIIDKCIIKILKDFLKEYKYK